MSIIKKKINQKYFNLVRSGQKKFELRLAGFKSGKYRILVATDIASRGIDVIGIELVLNYDLPTNTEDYVHRIGRTARAGGQGHAISLAQPEQRKELRDIERLIRKSLPISPVPELPPQRKPKFMPKVYQQAPVQWSKRQGSNFSGQNRRPFQPRRQGNRRRQGRFGRS